MKKKIENKDGKEDAVVEVKLVLRKNEVEKVRKMIEEDMDYTIEFIQENLAENFEEIFDDILNRINDNTAPKY